jgi:hypothetical protein
MGFALTNKTIDKYFGYLVCLDNNSKKKLIIKLTESIETNSDESVSLNDLFGAWDDRKDSDVIIKEIKDSRVEKKHIAGF